MKSKAVRLSGMFVSVATGLAAGSLLAQQERDEVVLPTAETPFEERLASVADPNWKAPRTSWGHPDIQGTFSSDDMYSIPRERPESFGLRERLAPEEFAERAAADSAYRHRILNEEAWFSRSWSVRTFGYSSQIIDPPDGRMPAATAAALPRSTRGSYSGGPYDTFEDFNLYDRCITRGMSSIMPSPARYGNGVSIVQGPDRVAISYEMVHETRVIMLDNEPVTDDVKQYLGRSRGYWDGDTLVVETRNLTDKTNIGNVQNSESLKITERFRRVDPDVVEYIGTFEDPETFEAPFTYRLMLTTQPGYRIYEYSCHEGNTAVSQGLSGERAFEQRVADALARGEQPPTHERSDGLGALPEEENLFFDVNAGE